MQLLQLAKPVESLKAYQIPLTATKGNLYLEELNQKIVLLSLYKQLFPVEWARSKASLLQRSQTEVYCDRELEFLGLVNERLFPLDNWEDSIQRSAEIPIYPQTASVWEVDLEDLTLGEQFLISLVGEGYSREQWQELFGFTPTHLATGDEIDWEQLEKLSRSAVEPLAYLYDAISMLDRSTGCIWLDITYETYVSYPWTKEVLLELAREWQVAQQYLLRQQQFEEWIEFSVIHRQETVKLWNSARK
ncbi:MAG: hypothetical protein N4J56_004505 [Chroococcidiopsis sp. SAG 2025]|uniref:hypothetical protein n=1 Tax=Chroococcidiopsis sp. SAG 2025 TaxID=171389 RepID=UPI0029373FD4|nr:hypothetical protein [Chroococcidiopsis sp. SAG 2025]MDV2994851.1 hypothetical protein [Chroococcidiopsis sp. SAG 2025]